MDHRPSKRPRAKRVALDGCSSSSSSGHGIKFQALREDLKRLLDEKDLKPSQSGKKTPTLVDLSNDSSPPIVDLSQSDSQEIRDLFVNLSNMFPTTPIEYLEEQAEELAGKHAALERFITDHLTRNSEPPEYWTPKILSVGKVIKVESDVIETNAAVNLTQAGQGLNMTMDAIASAMTDDVPDPPIATQATEAVTSGAADAIVSDDDQDMVYTPKPGPSCQQQQLNETIDLTDGAHASKSDSKQTETAASSGSSNIVENEEDLANKLLETLVTLFPQTDPEFLHARAVEFGKNEEQMNAWIQEAVENNSAPTFPSRKDYEKRQMVHLSASTK
jgi:hypothetical protein